VIGGSPALDTAPTAEAAAALRACLAAPRWVQTLVTGRPYRSPETWTTAAARAFDDLPGADVLAALAAHPRIGAAPTGAGADAEASRREQGAVTDAGADVRAAIAAGNRAYEERFDRVFLIRAAGRSPEEILGELRRRLDNDAATELAEAREQLRQITLLRLELLLGEE
jgi:2-oxo-4-hydroxy-4-carboxy-5-ureidoimidazoline decarboxylase